MSWSRTEAELIEVQDVLRERTYETWSPPADELTPGACFICFPKGRRGPGHAGEPAWAAAVVMRGQRQIDRALAAGTAPGPYEPGLLALREGALLQAVVTRLSRTPQVVLVNATGRDHPRRAGLALHLGAVLDLPTIGVTDRPLLGRGEWPADEKDAMSPLTLDGDLVGYWVRTRAGRRPIAAHAAWRTDPASAAEITLRVVAAARTPEPLRLARRAARLARAGLPDHSHLEP